jgi:Helix-turn-helix domain
MMIAGLKETQYEAGPDGRTVEPPVNWQAVNCVTLFSGVGGNDLLVLMAIARFVRAEGKGQGTADPSIKTLEALTRLSRRTVQRCLQGLEEAGELCIEENAGRFGTNLYTIPMLEAGGVRATHELPPYMCLVTENREHIVTESRKRKKISTQGSSCVRLTPEVNRLKIREISLKLADILIAGGRKHPGYRTDAESRDWRYGVELLGLRVGLPVDEELVEDLFYYIATTDKWKHIQTPKDIHDHYHEICDDMQASAWLGESEGGGQDYEGRELVLIDGAI